MSSIITDFWTYCQVYEIPQEYATLSALSMIASATGRRVFIKQGDIIHHSNLYVCLVGEQGGRKSVTKDFARDFYIEAYPDAVVGASMQSREDIVKFLSNPDTTRSFRDVDGVLIEYHPVTFFINELKNFLSYNPAGMIEFLTDIYDRKFFDASTIKRGLEKIPNPCLNILACETPEWIVDKLKTKVVSGGFSRRMLYVYVVETSNPEELIIKPRPIVSPQAKEAKDRLIEQLKMIENYIGEFKWTRSGGLFFDDWYASNKRLMIEDDPMIKGYRRTKDVQLLKVCMLLALSQSSPKLEITDELLQVGLAVLEPVETNLPKLSVATGRNELAVPMQKTMEMLSNASYENVMGLMPEKKLQTAMSREFTPLEIPVVLNHLRQTEQIVMKRMKINEVEKVWAMLPKVWETIQKNGTI